jgi:hypothetical protein
VYVYNIKLRCEARRTKRRRRRQNKIQYEATGFSRFAASENDDDIVFGICDVSDWRLIKK